jgi:hypothetical protein
MAPRCVNLEYPSSGKADSGSRGTNGRLPRYPKSWGQRGMTMQGLQRYRDAAARCLELATQTNDPNTRAELLMLAQRWHQFATDDDRIVRAVLGAAVTVGGEVTQFMYVLADGISKRMPWLKPHETLREANVVTRAALEHGL